MSDRTLTQTKTAAPTFAPVNSGVLQRKCDCGNHTVAGGECAECGKKDGTSLQRSAVSNQPVNGVSPIVHDALRSSGQPLDPATRAFMEPKFGHEYSQIPVHLKTPARLQAKLTVNMPGDSYEQEADRIADQVLAAPSHSAVSAAPPRIQRYAGHATAQADTAPASVDRVLASPGRSLEPTLRQDMEQRFGYDFSKVRVHSGAGPEQSARDVNANAYTAGHHIVFGAGRFAPGTHEGRRLLAHELTHVVQQSSAEAIRADQGNEQSGLSPVSTQSSRGGEALIQRDEAEDEQRRKATFGTLTLSPEVAASWGMPSPPPGTARKNESKSHVTPPGLGPKPGPRTLEEVIAATNVDPHRHKPARETPAPGDEEVMKMTGIERLSRAKDFAKEDDRLSAELKAEIDALFTWQALTGMALFAALYIAAQVTPAGWVADALAGAVLVISAIFVGDVLYEIFKNLAVFVSAINARRWIQLRESGNALARAIAKATVAVVVALLTRTVKGAVGGAKPYGGPPGPGFLEATTPEGFVLRAPVSAPAAAIPLPKSPVVNLASKALVVGPPTGVSDNPPGESRSDEGLKSKEGTKTGSNPDSPKDTLLEQRATNSQRISELDKTVQNLEQQYAKANEQADNFQKNSQHAEALERRRQATNLRNQINERELERTRLKNANVQLADQIDRLKTGFPSGVGPPPGKPHGGAHGSMEPWGGERHHIPPDSIAGLRAKGPAIWMEQQDHLKTQSWGSGKAAENWRTTQKDLIDQGKLREAVQMDINDIRSKFGAKYDKGIQQMLDYINTLNPADFKIK